MTIRCIYLTLINYENDDGYNRKTIGQLTAFKSFGWDVNFICYRNNSIAIGKFVNNLISWSFQTKQFWSIVFRRLLLFWYASSYIIKNSIDVVYIRYPRVDVLFAMFLLYVRLRIPSN